MTELRIQKVKKVFASGSGVFDVSLTIAAGEFFVLLGPSGCGKSTLLRLIAGLEEPDSGEISVDSAEGTKPPVAMVFQSYALYPHMTAFENIAFPLKLRGETREEIA